MNLLSVIHYPVFGGPHNGNIRISRPLEEQGWHVVVLLPDGPGNAVTRMRDSGVDVRTTALHRVRATLNPAIQARYFGSFWREVQEIRSLIRESRADVVMLNGFANSQAAFAAHFEGVAVAWQIIGTRNPALLQTALLPIVRRFADVVMTTGHFMAAGYQQRLPNLKVIPSYPPVDCSRFAPDPDTRSELRASLGIGPTDFLLGSVANINPQKGIEYLIEALSRLNYSAGRVRLALVGAEYENHAGYSKSLRRLMVEKGLREGEDVLFLGDRNDIERQLQAFDAFVMGSVPRSEGTPTAAIEAMACALPVVATDVGGVKDLVEDGITGFLVPPLQSGAITSAVQKLLDDDALRHRLGETARGRAQDRFDIATCAETHMRAFEVALDHRKSRGGKHRLSA